MKLEWIDILIFIIYIVGIVALGLYASRSGTSSSKRDYFLAGDKLPWWMIGSSIIAANISSHHLVGAMGAAYDRGFVAITLEWGAILIGFNALLWVFLPFYPKAAHQRLHRVFGQEEEVWKCRGRSGHFPIC